MFVKRLSIRTRQIGTLLVLLLGFALVAGLAFTSLRQVEDSAQASTALSEQQQLAAEIDGLLEDMLEILARMGANPTGAESQILPLMLRLDEGKILFERGERYEGSNPRWLQARTVYTRLYDTLTSTAIPHVENGNLDMLDSHIPPRLDDVRRLRADVQVIEGRVRSDIIAQTNETDEFVDNAVARIMLALLLLAALTATLLLTNIRAVSTGVRRLTDGAYLLARNQLSAPIAFEPGRKDEFTQLAGDFNHMADAIRSQRVALQDQMRALEEARSHAEEATRLKSDFLANMSHELRAPLHLMMNFTKLVADGEVGEVTPAQAECLNKALDASRHLLTVINDVLDMARIEAGQIDLHAQVLALPPLIDEMRSNTEALLKEDAKAVEVQVVYPPEGLPPVMADPTRVRQVLLNLVSNAVRFTDRGYIRFTFAIGQESVTVGVEDTGVGIPTDKLNDVFDRFRQVQGNAEANRGGTGLGLTIARDLVRLQGGRIWVTSIPGAGSSFYFTLPLASHPAPTRRSTGSTGLLQPLPEKAQPLPPTP